MQEPSRQDVTRIIAGYVAIAFILPYLAIKIAWISGVPVGMTDKNLVAAPGMLALNILTFFMDAVAVLLALTFAHRWGLRAPRWPVLFPMWVGTGFLSPIVIATPIVTLARMLGLDSSQRSSYEASAGEQALLEPWVTGMVFTSFVGQGLSLMTAFILYAQARWGAFLRTRIGDGQPPRPAIALLGNSASVVAAAAGLVHLLWVAGAPLGLPPRLLSGRGANFYLLHATFGMLALGAAAGIVVLANRLGRWPLWLPLSLAWTGSGATFCWGAWLLLANVMMFSRGEGAWLLTGVNIIKTVDGLLIGALIVPLIATSARVSSFTATSPK
jgi:hypothetical protein